MKNKNRSSPELVVAVMAVIIGLATMLVYIYQARIMSKQMQATTWPYLEIVFSNTGDQFSITVKNKGTGPAIVKDALIRLDGVPFPDTQKNADSIASLLTGSRSVLNGYTNINNRVVSPSEVIPFIEINDSTSIKRFYQGLRKHKAQLEICYCSVFDECWIVASGKVEPCDRCPTTK